LIKIIDELKENKEKDSFEKIKIIFVKAREIYGSLPLEVQAIVAYRLGVPLEEVNKSAAVEFWC